MASITNPVHFPTRTSRFSSLYLSPIRISPNLIALKSRSLVKRASGMAFSPLLEALQPCKAIEVSDEALVFSGLSKRLRKRSCSQFPVVLAAAADAESHEIEISEGYDLLFLKEKENCFMFGW